MKSDTAMENPYLEEFKSGDVIEVLPNRDQIPDDSDSASKEDALINITEDKENHSFSVSISVPEYFDSGLSVFTGLVYYWCLGPYCKPTTYGEVLCLPLYVTLKMAAYGINLVLDKLLNRMAKYTNVLSLFALMITSSAQSYTFVTFVKPVIEGSGNRFLTLFVYTIIAIPIILTVAGYLNATQFLVRRMMEKKEVNEESKDDKPAKKVSTPPEYMLLDLFMTYLNHGVLVIYVSRIYLWMRTKM